MSEGQKEVVVRSPQELGLVSTRRGFLRALGLGGTIVLMPSVFAACSDDNKTPTGNGGGTGTPVVLNLSNDIGIINYAYALEQLEAAFYTQAVAASSFSSLSAGDQELITDLRNHEVIHREVIKAALGTAAIGALTVDFGNSFSSGTAMLNVAKTLEDTGVAAYNGAARYLKAVENVAFAGKIVSVEARHASAIRDTLDANGNQFAATTDANGLDPAQTPSAILSAVAATGFLKTSVTIGTQPS